MGLTRPLLAGLRPVVISPTDTDSSLPDVRMPVVVACTSATGGDGQPLASELVGTVDGAAVVLLTGAS